MRVPVVEVRIVLMSMVCGFMRMEVRVSPCSWSSRVMLMFVMSIIVVMEMDMGYRLMAVGVFVNEQVGTYDPQSQ